MIHQYSAGSKRASTFFIGEKRLAQNQASNISTLRLDMLPPVTIIGTKPNPTRMGKGSRLNNFFGAELQGYLRNLTSKTVDDLKSLWIEHKVLVIPTNH
ncbi:MAG: hypothetical protein CM15mP49_02970 [Actinomycetota bacterium]|nr:MAG: hypothetical protein CM15mP49_02970 [Actinomycetota bacterium]